MKKWWINFKLQIALSIIAAVGVKQGLPKQQLQKMIKQIYNKIKKR